MLSCNEFPVLLLRYLWKRMIFTGKFVEVFPLNHVDWGLSADIFQQNLIWILLGSVCSFFRIHGSVQYLANGIAYSWYYKAAHIMLK